MKVKTSELIGPALDWIVAASEGMSIQKPEAGQRFIYSSRFGNRYNPSTDWTIGGPLIEREEIGTRRRAPAMRNEEWEAMGSITAKGAGYKWHYGPTPLIAAMRCFVASRIGEEVEIPDELL